jgi:hypothetical protein
MFNANSLVSSVVTDMLWINMFWYCRLPVLTFIGSRVCCNAIIV